MIVWGGGGGPRSGCGGVGCLGALALALLVTAIVWFLSGGTIFFFGI